MLAKAILQQLKRNGIHVVDRGVCMGKKGKVWEESFTSCRTFVDQGLLVSSTIWNGQEKKTGFLETKIYFIPLIFP
jgi:hypothetical protein